MVCVLHVSVRRICDSLHFFVAFGLYNYIIVNVHPPHTHPYMFTPPLHTHAHTHLLTHLLSLSHLPFPLLTHNLSLTHLPPPPPHSPQTRFSSDDDDIGYVMYDLDDLDINWLESVNQKRKFRGLQSK